MNTVPHRMRSDRAPIIIQRRRSSSIPMIPSISIMAVRGGRLTRGAVNGADPCSFLASRPKRWYQKWTGTEQKALRRDLPLFFSWCCDFLHHHSSLPGRGGLERVIEFLLFVWLILILVVSVERISLPRTCQPRHGSLWITRSPSYHQACSIFVPIIQYSNWFVDVCRCFLLIAFFDHYIVQRRPPRAQLDARVVKKNSQSHFKMSHGALSTFTSLFWAFTFTLNAEFQNDSAHQTPT